MDGEAGRAEDTMDRVAYREQTGETKAAPIGVHDALGTHEDTLQSTASSIEQLDAILTELEGRLGPVLSPHFLPSPEAEKRSPDGGQPDRADRAERSPLAERVDLLTAQVRVQRRDTVGLAGRIRVLLDRLEV